MARTAGRLLAGLNAALDGQRGALFPWVPVWLGTGIGVYFLLGSEPKTLHLWLACGAALVLALAALRLRAGIGIMLMVPALLLLGLGLAGMRARLVAAPVLEARIYGPLEGRIIEIDRSASGKMRLTLDQVVFADLPPGKVPQKVRISLQRPQPWFVPTPGQRVITTATLAPPEGPVVPGGFDFRRHAWFHSLGAIGYTQSPVLQLDEPKPGELRVARFRHGLATRIRAELDGQAGAFAAAILTGDYDGLTEETMVALRASNLIHLISISGLHMVLLCGAVFWAVRAVFSLSRHAALHWPVRQIAAVAALLSGAFYYLLSGGAIPAERAWVMIAVVFGAVLVGRRAISLQSLAIAALIVLVMRPEGLVDAGFQMSFAATLALVAGMEPAMARMSGWPPWLRTAALAVLSSSFAGFGSAAFAAAHFNRFADYGLVANLIAAPLMGFVVMPLCVVWMVALPLGFSQQVLGLMGIGIDGVLAVGAAVANLPGATTMVPSPAANVLPMFCAGGLLLCLWRGGMRLVGLPIMLAAFWIWQAGGRPELLISRGGGLVGVMTEAGRALSKAKGDGYVAERWLERDGDGASQSEAAARPGIEHSKGRADFTFAGFRITHLIGKQGEDFVAEACETADLVISSAKSKDAPCRIWDAGLLEKTGSIAISRDGEKLRLRAAEQVAAGRIWIKPQNVPIPSLPEAPQAERIAKAAMLPAKDQ